jgi:uncharacterized protein (DUF362 family)
MADIWSIVHPHVEAAVAEAAKAGHPSDTVGRALLGMSIDLFRRSRGIDDIRRELEAALENLDPDEDYNFMRP